MEAEGDNAALDAALIGAAQKVEHYEIAAYGTLRTFAATLGRREEAQLLQEILDQEAAADEKLTDIAVSASTPTPPKATATGAPGAAWPGLSLARHPLAQHVEVGRRWQELRSQPRRQEERCEAWCRQEGRRQEGCGHEGRRHQEPLGGRQGRQQEPRRREEGWQQPQRVQPGVEGLLQPLA